MKKKNGIREMTECPKCKRTWDDDYCEQTVAIIKRGKCLACLIADNDHFETDPYEFKVDEKERTDFFLEQKRETTQKHLPKLVELVNGTTDYEFITFVQDMVDNYMMNVCKLGRSNYEKTN